MHRQPRLLFGTSASVAQVLDQCVRFARTSDPIVLLGERGTGKTALAEHIHGLSGRRGPFVEESAAGLPRDLELARLTGHVRGAFTDAREDRAGLLESANHGTFFLDEIHLASAQLQGILLRLLERSTVRRLGDVRERPVDLRLIVAGNEDLHALAGTGQFRADLLDRFGCMVVRLPPLSARREEILPLAERFLAEAAGEMGLAACPSMSGPMRGLLLSAAWPGNIRQLRAVCRTAVALAAPSTLLGAEHLPLDFVAPLGDTGRVRYARALHPEFQPRDGTSPTATGAADPSTRRQTRRRALAVRIQEALTQTGGNRAAAARLLQISRTQLYRHLEPGPAA